MVKLDASDNELPNEPGVGLFYTYTDHPTPARRTSLGNVSALSDKNGTYVTDSLGLHRPFGSYRVQPTTNPTITDRGFTGHRSNNTGTNDLGLIYMNARFFLPELGRFATADTIVPDPINPQQFNRYAYSLNNPLNRKDPSGHCSTDLYDEYDDYECWQQYNYLNNYLTNQGYNPYEYLGSGSQWAYLPDVFDSERIEVLPDVHRDMSNNLKKTGILSFKSFSQGYHFYSIYHAKTGIAFTHRFLNELDTPPRHQPPNSYILAETFSAYALNTSFRPYGGDDFSTAYNILSQYGMIKEAKNLNQVYTISSNPMSAPPGLGEIGKTGKWSPLILAIELQVDITSDYLINDSQ